MILAPLKATELSATAFVMSALPAISAGNAYLAGISKAYTVPKKRVATPICHTVMISLSVRIAMARAGAADNSWVTMIIFFLDTCQQSFLQRG
ncbi:hypothetical protein M1N01_00605 [Thermodesulfovibrionales bacterium]|nr:hypothetical protein [Thermodesulfovibrionales bacterium]